MNPKVVIKPVDQNQGQNALNPPKLPVHLPDQSLNIPNPPPPPPIPQHLMNQQNPPNQQNQPDQQHLPNQQNQQDQQQDQQNLPNLPNQQNQPNILNLPMSTGCITTALTKHEHWTLVLRTHVLHNYRSQCSWNSKPEPYHEQAWTNQEHWVNIVKRKKINMNWTVSHKTDSQWIRMNNIKPTA